MRDRRKDARLKLTLVTPTQRRRYIVKNAWALCRRNVAITRAMRALTLTHCRARTKFGSAVSCQLSSFIRELAPEFIEEINRQKLLSAPVTETTARSRFAQMRAAIQSP